jgi:hypothetical protein
MNDDDIEITDLFIRYLRILQRRTYEYRTFRSDGENYECIDSVGNVCWYYIPEEKACFKKEVSFITVATWGNEEEGGK